MKAKKTTRLPQGWHFVRFRDFVKLDKGKNPEVLTKNYSEGLLPYLEAEYFRSGIAQQYGLPEGVKVVWSGDLLMICDGSKSGEIFLNNLHGIMASTMSKILFDETEYDKRFLRYFVQHKFLRLNDSTTGSGIPHVSKEIFFGLEMPVPSSSDEQIKISQELERKMSGLEKMRQAALKQKEAISAMKGAILRESIPYTENDKLPAGWDLIELSNLFTIEKEQIDNSDPSFSSLPFIGMENIESHTRKFVISAETVFEQGESTCLLFNSEHVLYGKLRPYLDKVYLPDKPGRCSPELLPLKPKSNYSRNLIVMVLQSPLVINYAVKHSTGGRMPRANMGKLIKMKVPLPAKDSEKEKLAGIIATKLKEADAINDAINKKLEAIEAMQGAILREVFDFQEINN